MRINRRIRVRPAKPNGVWPPPETIGACKAAVRAASAGELHEALKRLADTPAKSADGWKRDGLEIEVEFELARRRARKEASNAH